MALETISKRRSQLSEFRDLFSALFKIPDREVQNRVLRAVNGIVNETCDCECCKKITKDVGTQTDFCMTNINKVFVKDTNEKLDEMGVNGNDINSEFSQTFYGENDKFVINENRLESLRDREFKARRKRTKKIPRVEKAKDNVDLIKLNNGHKRPSTSSLSLSPSKQSKIEKSEGHSDLSDIEDLKSTFCIEPAKTDVLEQMKKEWKMCLEYTDGLLPIHNAIILNDLNKLKRQMFVLNFRSINIHKLLSDDGQSPLQLAIKMNSTSKIIIHLLESGADTQEIDENGNTIIHLAVLYLQHTKTLLAILKPIQNNLELLLVTNNDGLSALHLGIIHNKFDMCKAFLEYVNQLTKFKHTVEPIGNEKYIEDSYLSALYEFSNQDVIVFDDYKTKFVNQKDTKHGRTALFFALEQQSKILTIMLLCHLANPNITDYAGVDCHTYAGEHFDNSQILLALLNTSHYIDKCQEAMNARKCYKFNMICSNNK